MAFKGLFQLKPFYDMHTHVCGERTLILESREGRGEKSCVNSLFFFFFFSLFLLISLICLNTLYWSIWDSDDISALPFLW